MKDKKAEHMTALSGKDMVSKSHERIIFRGLVDSLEAEVIEAQVLAVENGNEKLCGNFGEVLDCLRSIMAADVKEVPLKPFTIFGMDSDTVRLKSHDSGNFEIPSHSHGILAARINSLRTSVRELEVSAVKVYGSNREDIVLYLNRLSSALWWLYGQFINDHRQ